MNTGTIASPHHWRIVDVLVRLNSEHRVSANEILHPGILTWNPCGEIVNHGRNIFGTDIADLLQYLILPHDPHIPYHKVSMYS